ncbi:MAG: hypothetical protein JXR96_05375 [Deltaproteobacteria bacterium]|nr:hypothetical protein [Deltaproteobacteria bacterium]
MNARLYLVIISVTALMVAVGIGCATVGKKFDTTHANEVQDGVQNKDQIIAWFGQPHQQAPVSNHPKGCVERWTWVHSHAVVGQDPKTQTLIVDFGSDGKVCDHAFVSQ